MNKYLSSLFPAQPIWLRNGGSDDEYVDFLPEITLKKQVKYIMRIAADGDYSVYAGDELVGFGQYSDYPDRLVYDDIPITPDKDLQLRITAWHIGADSQTHIRHKAYAVFCLYENRVPVYSSSESTPSRPSAEYVQHRSFVITGQMGLGFSLDGRTVPAQPVPSAAADIGRVTVCGRPNRRLECGPRLNGRILKSGRYSSDGNPDDALYMKNAGLGADEGIGSFYLFDLGREAVGFPEISFTSDDDVRVCVGWGEHIADGMCRCAIHSRRFTFGYSAHKGGNRIFPVLRRLGCRYIQIFIEGHPSDVTLDFTEVVYPVKVRESGLSGLRRRIYDTAVHTLRCCMHEHYEDCPWREQCLYTLDSRNQMIAGYEVFEGGNTEMVRSSLDLISRGVRPDGLLTLCYPAGLDLPIPFYTLAYFIQFYEYVRFSGDQAFFEEKKTVLDGLMNTVISRMAVSGRFAHLVPRWDDVNARVWNFYEWSPGMDGGVHIGDKVYDAPFNAFLVLALNAFSDMLRGSGMAEEADRYSDTAEAVRIALTRVFARPDGFYSSFAAEDAALSEKISPDVSVLTQALVLLSGACDGRDTGKMLSVISDNGGYGSVPASIAMACFRYDALLRADREKYIPLILKEIDRDGEYMLSKEATTFWETIDGDEAFGKAGSLCHGWSAMAAYYYPRLSGSRAEP